MDERTIAHYDNHSHELSGRYESADMSHLYHLMLRYLPEKGSTLLEVGCGSGRDAAFLLANGYDVTAIDPSAAMIAEAARIHPELANRVLPAAVPLPEDSPLLGRAFDAVVSNAVFMHIPDQDLFAAAFQIRRVLRPGGVLFLSVSLDRTGIRDDRDVHGRLFRERPAEEYRLLFERLGCALVAQHETPDSLARFGMRWVSLVFRREVLP